MDAMSPSHPATDGDFMKGTQIGGSEALYNAIGYTIDQVPCPIMLVMPTVDTAQLVSKQRLQPMFDETPTLSKKIGELKSRGTANTTLRKDYPGGLFLIRGANSGPGLRAAPVRWLGMDEIDAYPDDVDGEGDPCAVAEKRTDQFGARAKRFACSSPKIKGKSRIDRRYQRGTHGHYYVPCPHCAHEQVLAWGQVKWEMEVAREFVCGGCGTITELHAPSPAACPHCARPAAADSIQEKVTDDVAAAWYECEACRVRIDEHHKTLMLERGRWIHEAPGIGEVLADDDPHPHAIWVWIGGHVRRFLPRFRRPLSWQLSALYSPLGWFSWRKAVAQRLEAEKGGYNEDTGESLLQVFYNTVLGEPYEVPGEQPQEQILKLRAEPYELGQVPAGALVLTAAVDLQGDRFEVKVKGYGRGHESWLVDYHQIPYAFGKKQPGPEQWQQLLALRDRGYPHAGGQTVRIAAMGIDSGYLTQDVYAFCRTWAHKHVFALKGVPERGKPALGRPTLQDVNYDGRVIKEGVRMWPVGVDGLKEMVYTRLALASAGPGFMHFPRGLPDAYFDGLTAEKLIRRRVKGVDTNEWVKTRERNEPLDLEVYCWAAAIYAQVPRMTPADWDLLERVVNPQQQDLFAPQAKNTASTGAAGDAAATVSGAVAVDAPAAPPVQTSALWARPRGRRVRNSGTH